jgi:hypothetical protein
MGIFFGVVAHGRTGWAQCSVNAGSDVTVYAGYPSMACATLTAVPTGAAPYSYSWSNGLLGLHYCMR